MRRVKGATKFTIIQVIIGKLVHPRYFLSTIFFPLPFELFNLSSLTRILELSLLFVKKENKKRKNCWEIKGKEKNKSIQVRWMSIGTVHDRQNESTFKRV